MARGKSYSLIGRFISLDRIEKSRFLKECFEVLGRESDLDLKDEVFTSCLDMRYPEYMGRAEIWMEGRFRNDMSMKPKVVAYECASYLDITKKMIPHLIKTAQRVKDRLRKEMGREVWLRN